MLDSPSICMLEVLLCRWSMEDDMNDHGVTDGEHGGTIAEQLMESGAGRTGLDRRHLLGALAAGAAGLMLPRLTAAQEGPPPAVQDRLLKLIRFEVHN